MKRTLFSILAALALLLCVSGTWALDITYTSSGSQDSDALIVAAGKVAYFGGVEVLTNGSVDATADIYCGTGTGGLLLMRGAAVGASLIGGGLLPYPIRCSQGLYLDISGTGAAAILYYK